APRATRGARAESFERDEGFFAPREHGPAPVLSAAECDEPVRKLRVPGPLLAKLPLDSVVGVEKLPVTRLDVLDLGDAVRHRAGAAEEELEQELGPNRLEPGGESEPPLELLVALGGQRVDVAIRIAVLRLTPALGAALGGEPVQDRVDLAIALVPEVGHGSLDQLFDVVAGHGAAAQRPEDRVSARVRPLRRRPGHNIS